MCQSRLWSQGKGIWKVILFKLLANCSSCWQDSVFQELSGRQPHVHLTKGHLTPWEFCFNRANTHEDSEEKWQPVFYNVTSDVPCHLIHFCLILVVRKQLLGSAHTGVEGITKGSAYQEVISGDLFSRHLEAILSFFTQLLSLNFLNNSPVCRISLGSIFKTASSRRCVSSVKCRRLIKCPRYLAMQGSHLLL